MPDPFVIRPAAIADAPGIARVHWRSHQTTYVEPGRVARDKVEGWTYADRIRAWTTNLAIANDVYPPPEGFHRMGIWVAEVGGEHGGEVVGWANTSTGRDSDGPRALELEGLYVLDEFHGGGVGQALLDTAVGDRPAYLWALADNPRAHAFYRRNGFELDGTSKVDDFWQVHEVRFVR
ncbi:GNAT superfamily N-acetyltransferase [Agromyces hippuratus]|uniref:GNAT superfamily N-acetyltransferase n=1 Tax=Agromyces hippuratus TaxID=286438 RepID=A0A852X790_9MICO|nr:GNAT family N-acetyltransferase [Agromyces hippuratus]NYG21831.1 GNAT superfamily N-acetyltransferase [Agromyces hippuratus]